MYLVLVRHGESVWNKENKFTGWMDVPLSEKGIEEAKRAGVLISSKNINFSVCYTSLLKRAIDTYSYIKEELPYDIKLIKDYRLNERHYGALQGLNKEETAQKYGSEQVKLWRRSYDVRPPSLTYDDERYPGKDPMYKDIPKNKLPLTESLKDTYTRVVELYNEKIKKDLYSDNVLIVAHGNSLRALIKYLDNISDEDITNLEIETGKPIIYEFDNKLNVIGKENIQ